MSVIVDGCKSSTTLPPILIVIISKQVLVGYILVRPFHQNHTLRSCFGWQNLLHLSSSYLMQIMQLIYGCLHLNQILYHKSLNQPRILDLGICIIPFYHELIEQIFPHHRFGDIVSIILFHHFFLQMCGLYKDSTNNIYCMWTH